MLDIILLSGKQGSGKTTTAEELIRNAKIMGYDFAGSTKFAEVLYELHEYLLNRMEVLTGKPRVKKDGKLLQLLGTEWGRETYGVNVWVDITRDRVMKYSGGTAKRLVIIDDARFENEFDAFPEALRVRLGAPANVRKSRTDAWRDNEVHPSETGLDNYEQLSKFDLYISTEDPSTPSHTATLILAQLNKRSWLEKRGN